MRHWAILQPELAATKALLLTSISVPSPKISGDIGSSETRLGRACARPASAVFPELPELMAHVTGGADRMDA
jgi:hypothetical protein